MGPVLAVAFGVHLRKFDFARNLFRLGLKNECISLLVCIVVGFVVGIVLVSVTKNDPESTVVMPTQEMTSRSTKEGLMTGAVIAFASGIGVALSVVGDYMATVIGVAISASLLPPAVNCGMLWALSFYVYFEPEAGNNGKDLCWPSDPNKCTANDLAIMGSLSIVLTIENIILVFLASWMMFVIKDVTLSNNRGFDDQNKQLVYQSIGSFKERYEDLKTMSSTFELNKKKKKKKKKGNAIYNSFKRLGGGDGPKLPRSQTHVVEKKEKENVIVEAKKEKKKEKVKKN